MDGRRGETVLDPLLPRSFDPRPFTHPAIEGKGVQSSPPPREGAEPSNRDPLPKDDSSKEETHRTTSESQRRGKGKGIKRGFSCGWSGRMDREVYPISG